MRSSPKLKPGIWDALVALIVLVMAAGCAFAVWSGGSGSGGGALEAVVRMDADGGTAAEIRMTLDGLNRVERTVTSNGYTLHIVLTETEVWVESSDCPTQDCVHTGHISRAGQSIVCLPARVIVQLVGGDGGEDPGVDAVIG